MRVLAAFCLFVYRRRGGSNQPEVLGSCFRCAPCWTGSPTATKIKITIVILPEHLTLPPPFPGRVELVFYLNVQDGGLKVQNDFKVGL